MKKGLLLITVLIVSLLAINLLAISIFNQKETETSMNTESNSQLINEGSLSQIKSESKTCEKEDKSCGVMVVEVNLIGFGKEK